MANIQNHFHQMSEAVRLGKTISSDTTLTGQDLQTGVIFGDTSDGNVALTLPDPGPGIPAFLMVVNTNSNNLTAEHSDGFGGVGSGGDVATFTQGEGGVLIHDGDYWYVLDGAAVA